MLIGELAAKTGVSTRALRHYEDEGLLIAQRKSNGYRHYDESSTVVVEQIRTMISAGLVASTIRRYLDCARSGSEGTTLDMCPELKAELDRVAAQLEDRRAAIDVTKARLDLLRA